MGQQPIQYHEQNGREERLSPDAGCTWTARNQNGRDCQDQPDRQCRLDMTAFVRKTGTQPEKRRTLGSITALKAC